MQKISAFIRNNEHTHKHSPFANKMGSLFGKITCVREASRPDHILDQATLIANIVGQCNALQGTDNTINTVMYSNNTTTPKM